jgi:hypothetical protein
VFIVAVTRNDIANTTGACNLRKVKCLEAQSVMVCGRKYFCVKVTENLNMSPFTPHMNYLHEICKLKA